MGYETSKLSYNVKHRATKQLLPFFFVDLISKPNNKQIFSLNRLLNIKIITESPQKRTRTKTRKCGEKHPANVCVAYITAWKRQYKSYNIYQPYDTHVKTQQYRSEDLSYASFTKQPQIRGTIKEENINEETMNNCLQHKSEEITVINNENNDTNEKSHK
ncbi:hypothetical protein HZH66_010501 [Vespula vulgaris]|uniref:Pre-C2HC domain-containing protein n=1 Tax=Vespula vulgaris TaxID=7454 RepID=A0A834JJH9_VESVU|nr:hypothetical protein HZH66_010501 [Vespula vulgaris]